MFVLALDVAILSVGDRQNNDDWLPELSHRCWLENMLRRLASLVRHYGVTTQA